MLVVVLDKGILCPLIYSFLLLKLCHLVFDVMASQSICEGIFICRNAPIISYLLFADDCFIFMIFRMEEVWCLKWFLKAFCHQPGLRINFLKSDLYVSPNMSPAHKFFLSDCLGIKLIEKPWTYVGATLDFSCGKGRLLSQILHHFKSKLFGWKHNLLSFAGRCVLAKHSLLSIPLYQLLVFKAPTYFIRQIRSVASNFIWKNSVGTGFIWKSWRHLCLPKSMGGIGLKDPGAMNQSSVS